MLATYSQWRCGCGASPPGCPMDTLHDAFCVMPKPPNKHGDSASPPDKVKEGQTAEGCAKHDLQDIPCGSTQALVSLSLSRPFPIPLSLSLSLAKEVEPPRARVALPSPNGQRRQRPGIATFLGGRVGEGERGERGERGRRGRGDRAIASTSSAPPCALTKGCREWDASL